MAPRSSALLFLLLLAGCAGDSSLVARQDADLQSSIQYDKVECKKLISQRNAIASANGVATDAKPVFADTPLGLGPVLPDIRSAKRQSAEKAAAEIDAMNRSLIRRQCIPKPAAS